MDYDKAFSADNGVIVDEENSGPFYTGGASSPVGMGLPVNTVYAQTDAAGIFIWKKVGAGDTASDWRKYSAQDVPFVDTLGLYYSNVTSTKLAFDNLRIQKISQLTVVDTNVGSSHVIDYLDNTLHDAIGTGSGFSFVLPDATTLIEGHEFEIANNSTNSIDIKDGSGSVLFALIAGDIVRAICTDNTSIAGGWLTIITSANASGIVSYSIGSDTTFTTSSSTDILVTGMTVTPVSGRYQCIYSSDITISSNNKLAQAVFYRAGSEVARSRRVTQGVSSNFQSSHNLLAEITVDGTQSIDIRVNVSGGSLDVKQRRMILTRLGA